MQKQEQKAKQTNPFSEMEEEVLNFWEKSKIFEKSVDNPPTPPLSRGQDKSPYPPFVKGGRKDYVFYDGPPFATGTPHYGHIVASVMKDVAPRYWTMQGYRVERRWGWDCHGLPIENIVEKELGTKSKKDIIEKIGIEKFNEICRSKVLGYVEDWKKVIRRLGRWADMENAYKTMDLDFMESVWWVFKELYNKGLIYEGYRSMLVCPRCETTLSQQEVAEGYKDIKDLSAVVKFELDLTPGSPPLIRRGAGGEGKTFVLAWTTTPWTLIGNVALAVGEDIEYVMIKLKAQSSKLKTTTQNSKLKENEIYILAKDRLTDILKDEEYEIIKELKGKSLIGLKYKPLFPYLQKIIENGLTPRVLLKKDSNESVEPQFAIRIDRDDFIRKNKEILESADIIDNFRNRAYRIYDDNFNSGNFVNTEEGTGVVHIAPAFGEDDMNMGNVKRLPFIQHIYMDGTFKEDVIYHDDELFNALTANNNPWRGVSVKPMGDHTKTDVEIIKYLAHHNLLFSKEKYEHSYPHCWRCETPLINYAITSWFVNILKIKDGVLKTAKKINWSPAHIKEGRFGKWLEGARDWSISRQRFWASVIPIWRCDDQKSKKTKKQQNKCGNMKVLGSVKELEELSGEKITDLHKHIIDKITFKCEKCDGEMKRVPDVLDTWFDSGSMPYAQMHYPFENKEKFEKNFPAEFIAEGIDQTRAWFYYLHAIANGIKKTHAFKNVIVNGIVLAEDGKKMSKRLNNYPDPMFVFDQYGADALRYYLLTSPVMFAENLNFAEKGVQESLRNVVMILWNVYKFYEMYAEETPQPPFKKGGNANTPIVKGGEGGFVHDNVLDQWILARLDELIKEVTDGMNNYNLPKAARPIEDFVNDFSTWYLRRSRERFKNTPPTPPLIKGGNEKTPLLNKEGLGEVSLDRQAAIETTRFILLQLSKIIAPFMPFLAENLWQKVTRNNFQDENKSVHLEGWPVMQESKKARKQESNILQEMEVVRKIVELGLAKRDEAGVKVRQPLNNFSIFPALAGPRQGGGNFQFSINDYINLIKDELNVKNIRVIMGESELGVELDAEITPELKLEGTKRELVRFINNLRKEAGMTIKDRAEIYYKTESEKIKEVFDKLGAEILKDTLSGKIANNIDGAEFKKEVKVNGEDIVLGIRKKI